ncbi:MAG: glycosyltransferase family 39 protein [Clostridia bacterium]|nr:glycosyltransferase family 39 protein [Clostridia bacterium]
MWHSKEYYEDYLTVNKNEKFMFSQVYENQKNDSHPPLYYLILRIAMGFNINQYSKWTGIILNIIIYAFITIFMYLIISKLLKGQNKYKEKSIILAFISSITLSSLTNVLFIRMYALSTLNIVITTYLHLKLLEKESKNNMLLVGIGISALIGSLTHYYYLFYLIALFIMFVTKYIKEKQYKQLGKYILTMTIAGILSLIIFPYSIQHMFFRYRGQGVLNNLSNIHKYIVNIILYIVITNVYVCNNFLIILLLGIGIICVYKLMSHKKIFAIKNRYVKYITIPTLFNFIIVSICSPYIELRYILPISQMIFILVIYFVFNMLNNICKEKTRNRIMISIFLAMFIMVFVSNEVIDLVIGKNFRSEQEASYSSKTELVENLNNECNLSLGYIPKIDGIPLDNVLLFIKDFKIEPQVMYSNKLDIMKKIEGELKGVPALYLFDSNNNRFLDDILLFANIEESYIAKDIECNEENIKEIIESKDISNGLLIFINDWQDNEKILEVIQKSINLYNVTYLQRLNMCDIYYIK